MKELYVGIDPSINSTGITINIWEDGTLFTEVFYIIKGNKLTRKEQKVSEDADLTPKEVEGDKLYDEITDFVIKTQKASASLLQRKQWIPSLTPMKTARTF